MTRNSSIVNIDSRNIGELLQYLGNNDIKCYEIYDIIIIKKNVEMGKVFLSRKIFTFLIIAIRREFIAIFK